MQPQGLHGGHYHWNPSRGRGGFSTTISPPNLVEVPAVTNKSLFYLPPIDQLRPPAQQKAQGLLSGSSTPSIMGHRLRPKLLDTTSSLQQQMAGEPYTPYRI
jgi:hypothetical protein